MDLTVPLGLPNLLEDLTAAQQEAVSHPQGPLLIVAGAGTGKTTVITRRIAWLLATRQARPEDILALTFTEKAAAEMQERVDLLVPYGYADITISTFHAFGDDLVREHGALLGLDPHARILTEPEQQVLLRRHLFELPLGALRPSHDPARHLEALLTVFARAKDEAVSPVECLAYADQAVAATRGDATLRPEAERAADLARAYQAYESLLRQEGALDFGDQIVLPIRLLEEHPDALAAVRRRFRYVLVDEFQDTNYAQFRLLQLLAPPGTHLTVVADDDQSIYKWRGAAISNVLKFLEHYPEAHTVVLTENFRSTQPILDCAYRLIRFNDPDRLEVHRRINKRLVAKRSAHGEAPHVQMFDTASSEADWVASTIATGLQAGRRPGEFAVLVRANRDADLFLRALNVAGLPWVFSGSSSLFTRPATKLLLSCLRALADPDDTLSWYHVASSSLYTCPMPDLTAALAAARKAHRSLREVIAHLAEDPPVPGISERGSALLLALRDDVERLLERSRTHSAGQVLYQWLADRGFLTALAVDTPGPGDARLEEVAQFFEQLRRAEELVGPALPELMEHLPLFQALAPPPTALDDFGDDAVRVLTLHKAKGLEFPVVFMVGLVQGRFPTPRRRDPLELPEPLIRDLLPTGDYHLQEERRLFYVGMTRAKDHLYLTGAYDYGGKRARKISQFVLEALDLPSPNPAARTATARELIARARPPDAVPAPRRRGTGRLRLDAHGADDYETCPLKYRFTHVLRLPVMRHHVVAYGAALHQAVEAFFKARLRGRELTEAGLLEVFAASWRAEGFLTRAHEELRFAQGQDTLRRFFAQQQRAPERPTRIEAEFRFPLDDLLVVGRWDRVDGEGAEAVIIDYKSSDVTDQSVADQRARDSLQLKIYALAWQTLYQVLPHHVELRFLDTGVIGCATLGPEDLASAQATLRRVASGIRAGAFQARPQEHTCRWCAYQAICPSAFQPL